MRRHARGLTLIELLIAAAIFAVVGVMAYQALFSLLESREGTQRAADRLAAVQYAVFRMTDDLRQLADRPVRSQVPREGLPLFTPDDGERVLAFTRGGRPNPAGQARGSLARVHWAVEDGRLLRYLLPWPDTLPGQAPQRRVLLERVQAVELRFLAGDDRWRGRWPPLEVPVDAAGLPRAVELTLVLEDWGEVIRLLPLPAADGGTGAGAG